MLDITNFESSLVDIIGHEDIKLTFLNKEGYIFSYLLFYHKGVQLYEQDYEINNLYI